MHNTGFADSHDVEHKMPYYTYLGFYNKITSQILLS